MSGPFTPGDILECVRQMDVIGLDPCGHPDSPVGALLNWCEAGIILPSRRLLMPTSEKKYNRVRPEYKIQDGLDADWRGHGLVWVFPPISGRGFQAREDVRDWTRKIRKYKGQAEMLALVPAKTHQDHFQWDVATSDVICFISGETKFPGSTCKSWCIGYWGERSEKFRAVFSVKGLCL